MTILNRIGNKSKIANKIIECFPEHKTYIEVFFGAGGIFFNKSLAKYNIVNDIDSDVYNLYQVLRNDKEKFIKELENTFIHNDLFNYWKVNKETDSIAKAIRFIFLSNLTLYGVHGSLHIDKQNFKAHILQLINSTNEKLKDVIFHNTDFRKFLNSITEKTFKNAFIYCDPPYLNTKNNYSNNFSQEDLKDLFEILISKKCNFAVSEFEHPLIIEQAEKYKLNINYVTERHCIKKRNTELLITNYKIDNHLFA